MNELKQLVFQILSSKEQKPTLYTNLLHFIQNNPTLVSTQIEILDSSSLLNMMIKKASKHTNVDFYIFLEKFIDYTTKHKSTLYQLIYQLIPILMTKYILTAEQKLIHLQNCIRAIYNHQYLNYNNKLISRQLIMEKNGEIAKIYKEHFQSQIKINTQTGNLSEILKHQEINSFNRLSVKNVLLLSVLNNLQKLTQKTVISYLWMIYVYCGGSQQEQQSGVSLYLLEKKNIFSIFKYHISSQEMSIILLTLYELSVTRKKNKFQILSAINMIHKKAANQSMFKLSEVAQSTIHLLEDQYSQAFS